MNNYYQIDNYITNFVTPTIHFSSITCGGHSTLEYIDAWTLYAKEKHVNFQNIVEFKIENRILAGHYEPSPGNKNHK